MAQKTADFVTEAFRLHVLSQQRHAGVTHVRVHAVDRFGARRHALERRAFGVFTRAMERYLRRRPHLDFEHPKNIVRKIVYFPPALRAWAAYMPGGFATFHVHNPDHKRLISGKKIDYITRNLFRHATDAVGLRSRAYAMTWFAYQHMARRPSLTWLSLACGTGQPTFDAARLYDGETTFYLADQSAQALEFARQLAREYRIDDQNVLTMQLDVEDQNGVVKLLTLARPDVIDAMGLFEYLEVDVAVKLLTTIRKHLKPDGIFVFTNMHAEHPQLQIHKRGLGWPGVIPRTTEQVLEMLRQAGFAAEDITVILPDDNVYAVFGLMGHRQGDVT